MTAPAQTLVRGAHLANVSPAGRPSYARVRGLIDYLSYGHHADRLGQAVAAREQVRVFLNGAPPAKLREDRFVTSALGHFTTRLLGYQKHIDTICPTDPARILDRAWAVDNQGALVRVYEAEGVGMDTVVWLTGEPCNPMQASVGRQMMVTSRGWRS